MSVVAGRTTEVILGLLPIAQPPSGAIYRINAAHARQRELHGGESARPPVADVP